MSKIRPVKKCYRCGNILQVDSPTEKGYITKEILEASPSGALLLCDECHEEQSKENKGEPNVPEDLLRMLKGAKASDALIVYVIDLFSFECAFSSKINELIQKLNLIVIANKSDLFPKSSYPSLRSFVSHRFRTKGLMIKDDDVFLTSLSSLGDVSEIKREIEERRNGHDVYIIGARTSGQTFFLNAFLRGYSNVSTRYVTTKEYEGKGERYMQIPLDMSSTLFQTPPISLSNSILGIMDLESALTIMPKDIIKTRKASLKPGEGLFFGPLAFLFYEKSNSHHVELEIRASMKIDIVKANDLSKEKTFTKLRNASSLELKIGDLEYYDAYDIEIEESGKRDIGVAGLGFVSFKGDNQKFRIYVPRGVAIYCSRSKM